VSVHMTETLPRAAYPWSDPLAILSCDALNCESAWVTADGLVSWRLAGSYPNSTMWSDQFVIGCNLACLAAAQRRHGPNAQWSAPMPVAAWLDTLRQSVELDPHTTPIGEIRRD
jgi:hypothetical protein